MVTPVWECISVLKGRSWREHRWLPLVWRSSADLLPCTAPPSPPVTRITEMVVISYTIPLACLIVMLNYKVQEETSCKRRDRSSNEKQKVKWWKCLKVWETTETSDRYQIWLIGLVITNVITNDKAKTDCTCSMWSLIILIIKTFWHSFIPRQRIAADTDVYWFKCI